MIEPHRALRVAIEGGEDVGPASALWSGGVDAAAWRDAADECSHGRLPGDPTAPCGCWPQEPEPEQEEPVTDTTTRKPRQKRKARQTLPPPAFTRAEAQRLGPVVPKVVEEIDAEIVRLQFARDEIVRRVRA